jgi:predicted alpha/beta-hydrolase family hydrolase
VTSSPAWRTASSELRTLTGPIVLVGHSYGGNVISVAAAGVVKSRGIRAQLVYGPFGWVVHGRCESVGVNLPGWARAHPAPPPGPPGRPAHAALGAV